MVVVLVVIAAAAAAAVGAKPPFDIRFERDRERVGVRYRVDGNKSGCRSSDANARVSATLAEAEESLDRVGDNDDDDDAGDDEVGTDGTGELLLMSARLLSTLADPERRWNWRSKQLTPSLDLRSSSMAVCTARKSPVFGPAGLYSRTVVSNVLHPMMGLIAADASPSALPSVLLNREERRVFPVRQRVRRRRDVSATAR